MSASKTPNANRRSSASGCSILGAPIFYRLWANVSAIPPRNQTGNQQMGFSPLCQQRPEPVTNRRSQPRLPKGRSSWLGAPIFYRLWASVSAIPPRNQTGNQHMGFSTLWQQRPEPVTNRRSQPRLPEGRSSWLGAPIFYRLWANVSAAPRHPSFQWYE